jgi:starch synthase (maltosyl-transferring)
MSQPPEAFAPKIYYFHPLIAGPRASWLAHLARCRDLGFSHVLSAPLFAPGKDPDLLLSADHDRANPAIDNSLSADDLVGQLSQACKEQQLHLLLDVVLGRVAADSSLAKSKPEWFRISAGRSKAIDPRSAGRPRDVAWVRFDDPTTAKLVADWWIERLVRLCSAGVTGFRCEDPDAVSPTIWTYVIGSIKKMFPHCRFLAWTPGLSWSAIGALRATGFDAAFSSVAWWDGRASWLIEEHELLRGIGVVIGCPIPPYGHSPAIPGDRNQFRHYLRRAAATSDALMLPMGLEYGVVASADDLGVAHNQVPFQGCKPLRAAEIRDALGFAEELARREIRGQMRLLSGGTSSVSALLRTDAADARDAKCAAVVLINTDMRHEKRLPISADALPPTAGMAATLQDTIAADRDRRAPLAPGEVRVVSAQPTVPIKARRAGTPVVKAATSSRIVIENVAPSVDGGSFPAKRLVGENVDVEADIFADGYDVLAVELLWRATDDDQWLRKKMRLLGNDRWRAAFVPDRIGRYLFTVEAWWDQYGTFCRELEIKHKAGADVKVEIVEGQQLLEHANAHSQNGNGSVISRAIASLSNAEADAAVGILLAPDLRDAMYRADTRRFPHRREPPFPLEVDRPQAAFAAWYELFPRSATDDPAGHGTFNDVIRRLPTIKDMGFDVLYLPPIHPIGVTNRKGKNNSLEIGPGDPGSPYAIGSDEGGHDTIHPALGTIKDFRRLCAAAAEHGMEVAIDFAIQCSPDHPWLKEHPEWFKWRPDGTVRYAENPPKKYQDIVNVDFYGSNSVPALWNALRDIVMFWRNENVRIFRVDNPHTKPLPFWQWLIAQVRERYPDVIFLSEAFTQPKMMYRLAKVGFTQSYTYFTWRNTKQELIDYFTELTTGAVKDYLRPHLFVNTPDINPYYLQTSGRPGFLVRAALAATLSGLWGIYSGFELCEGAALPGREEYSDSEKYEIRVRRFDAPGNIVSEIATLNRIRRSALALQSHLGLRFYPAHDDQVLLYGKMSPDRRDMMLIAVNLDPFHAHDVTIEVPLWEWSLPDDATIGGRDLMRDVDFTWHGKLQRIRLDPGTLPFAIWRLSPSAGS